MQSPVLKILLPCVLIILLTPAVTQAQLLQYHLNKADSLFQQKRYTQSQEIYQLLFDKGQYSPAMLLRMAYIEEGLGNVASTLYYLSVYYHRTHDDRVLSKINELAGKHRLSGYELTDAERFLSLYQGHHQQLTYVLLALTVLMLSIAVTRKRRQQSMAFAIVLSAFFTLLLGLHINLEPAYRTGITNNPVTYAMSGPSAGASVLKIMEEGHKLHIRGKKDVWLRVVLNGNDAFIRQDNLRLITP